MPAREFPASGDGPGTSAGTAKTCDARGMAEIHRMFRAGFGQAPTLVERVADNDSEQAEIVGDYLAMLSTGLHGHHEGETIMLWDRLETEAPACALHVERMKQQHAELLVHLTELDKRLPGWRGTGRVEDAAPVVAALERINAALAVHLPDEETHIVPVMETVLTPQDVAALSAHGRKSTPKGKMFIQLGEILAAQPDGGEEWQKRNLPAPVRAIWRLVGKPKYKRYRADLVR